MLSQVEAVGEVIIFATVFIENFDHVIRDEIGELILLNDTVDCHCNLGYEEQQHNTSVLYGRNTYSVNIQRAIEHIYVHTQTDMHSDNTGRESLKQA